MTNVPWPMYWCSYVVMTSFSGYGYSDRRPAIDGHLGGGTLAGRALMSHKSTLEPQPDFLCIGKEFDISSVVIHGDLGAFRAPVACWLQPLVPFCSRKRLQRYMGRLHWHARPRCGTHGFVASTWAHIVWATWGLPRAPLALLHSVATATAMCTIPWSLPFLPPSLPPPSDWARFVFIDGTQGGSSWRFGLWSLCQGWGNFILQWGGGHPIPPSRGRGGAFTREGGGLWGGMGWLT